MPNLPNAKWIEGIGPAQPLMEVARRTLAARLDVVWHYVPLAAEAADETEEYVHQLRVSSRRAVAAIHVFFDLLPPRRRQSLSKALRRIRRAAGPARDEDVLAARLERRAAGNPESGAGHLLIQVRLARQQAQQALVDVYQRLQEGNFPRRIQKLVEKVRWRETGPEPTFGEDAGLALANHVVDLQEAAQADLSDPATLHQLRIAGKHLRYAMEIFAPAFDEAFRQELYPQVERLQELLGEVNDHATAQRRFELWLSETVDDPLSATALETMIAEEQAGLAESQRAFYHWWMIEGGSKLLHAFDRYLPSSS